MIRQAQPALRFVPQAFNPTVYHGVRLLLPWWIKHRLGLAAVKAHNVESLVHLYQGFQGGQTRLFFAFRHPSTDDPFCMAYLLWHLVPRQAKAMGIPLGRPVHSHFMYDLGIPLWAGSLAGWIFPRLGGTTIQRGKADRQGLKAARDLLVNGQFPLAAAPEGATNDHSELVNPLEPGIAQLGFWSVEDLAKANRSEEVLIVPIGIQYRYVTPPWKELSEALATLEAASGLSEAGEAPGLLADGKADRLYGRLLYLSEHLLEVLEAFYERVYPSSLDKDGMATTFDHLPNRNAQLVARLHRLIERALRVAEQYFGLSPSGSFVDRCRRLEQVAWERIYRSDLEELSPLERSLADWQAAESSLRMSHMRLVERLTVVTGQYILERPTADRFAEIGLILIKIATWMQGGKPNQMSSFGPRTVQMTVGEPLSVSERWPTYCRDRAAARQAVTTLTQDLQIALENLQETQTAEAATLSP
nr:1-acyl-sn-glycerol-3-phosphate acyltransferase [Petrachloros mirabilis]